MRQIRNRGIRFARGATGPYARKLSSRKQARAVVLGRNLANDYIKDFNNWDKGAGVSFSQVDFGGRSGVWRLDNTSTSGITMTYDFAAREGSGGPKLVQNQNYVMEVDVYSPSVNTQTGAGTWYTTDTLGNRAWSTVQDQWKRLQTTLDYQAGDDLFANAAANLSASAGDYCFFDLNSMVIRRTA